MQEVAECAERQSTAAWRTFWSLWCSLRIHPDPNGAATVQVIA
jgi:hypothetical protein